MIRTRLLRVDPRDPDPAGLKDAAGILVRGGLVAFPTETFYGLGANALDRKAFGRVYAVKGRPEGKPLLVLVDSVRMVETLVEDLSPTALALMTRYWPGPLTLVLKAIRGLPAHLTTETGTIGVRLPAHPVAFGLVRAAGVPVTAPSANPSGAQPPTTATQVLQAFDGKIDLVIDGGATKGGLPSTILDVTASPPRILRKGALDLPEGAYA
ncbi:MAG: threonylcarbamoyl-AMP synthase [Candidatus Rokubacteria bacterium]|nr:threonylcarbamoyl-AMP synthase [Candidatus Rokubacteria bacterium]